MRRHINELTQGGQQFWWEIFESISGTDKTPEEIVNTVDKTIAGSITFTDTEDTSNPVTKHYKLSVGQEQALTILTEFFGFDPESGWGIQGHSSFCNEVGAVIFEITDDDYRLAKIGEGGNNHVVGWNRRK